MDKRIMICLRVKPADVARIDARARATGLSRSEYMVRCALGELVEPGELEGRVERLEERFGRLEEIAFQH